MSRRHVTWQDVKWVSEAFSDGFGDAGLHVRAQHGDQTTDLLHGLQSTKREKQ